MAIKLLLKSKLFHDLAFLMINFKFIYNIRKNFNLLKLFHLPFKPEKTSHKNKNHNP